MNPTDPSTPSDRRIPPRGGSGTAPPRIGRSAPPALTTPAAPCYLTTPDRPPPASASVEALTAIFREQDRRRHELEADMRRQLSRLVADSGEPVVVWAARLGIHDLADVLPGRRPMTARDWERLEAYFRPRVG